MFGHIRNLVTMMVFAGTIAGTGMVVRADSNDLTDQETRTLNYDLFSTNAPLGIGWNSVRNISMPNICIDFLPNKIPRTEYTGEMLLVSDTYSMAAQMGYSVEQQLNVIGGTFKQNSRTEFSFSTEISGSQSQFLARRFVRSHKTAVAPATNGSISIKDEYKHLSDAAFQAKCGEGYVESIIWGGELDMLATISETSASAKSNFENKTGAGSPIAGSSISTEVGAAMQAAYDSHQLSFEATSFGGTQPNAGADPDTFIKAYNDWQVDSSTATPIFIVVQSYDQLKDGIKMKLPPEYTVMQKIAIVYWRLANLQQSIVAMTNADAKKKWAFERVPAIDFSTLDGTITKMITDLKAAAKVCLNSLKNHDADSCVFPGDVNPLEEYDIRAQLTVPGSWEVQKYYQPPKAQVADMIWQFWLQDANNERLKNQEPYTMSVQQLQTLKQGIQQRTLNPPTSHFVYLTGSYVGSCKNNETAWVGSGPYVNRPRLTTQCGYRHHRKWPKKSQHKWRDNTVYFGDPSDPSYVPLSLIPNGAERANCGGTLKPKC